MAPQSQHAARGSFWVQRQGSGLPHTSGSGIVRYGRSGSGLIAYVAAIRSNPVALRRTTITPLAE